MNYSELINFFKIWGNDIHTISFKYYDEYIECLINEHFILTFFYSDLSILNRLDS